MLCEVLAERLPDIALVELGVAHQRYLPAGAGPPIVSAKMIGDVIAYERAENRSHRAEADRSSGEIHMVDVLGPRRIRLQAAKLAKFPQFLGRQKSAHELQRMEYRRGVR